MTDATDAELAASIATAAGELLFGLRSAGTFSGKALGDEGDRQANDAILARLSSARPNDAVLSEESVDTPARLHADRCWIIDPLDGTREYVIPGRSDWAVHVALWERGREITAAAVAQPALGVVHRSDEPTSSALARSDRSDRPHGPDRVPARNDRRPAEPPARPRTFTGRQLRPERVPGQRRSQG